MKTFFEVKVKYEKICQDGKEKMVTETYLVDATSFSEAEARTHKELEPYISGEIYITSMRIANYSEIIPNDVGDKWFKGKISFISIDEEKGTEKKMNTYVLVQASETKEIVGLIENAFEDSVVDYVVPAVSETPIIDIFKYSEE